MKNAEDNAKELVQSGTNNRHFTLTLGGHPVRKGFDTRVMAACDDGRLVEDLT